MDKFIDLVDDLCQYSTMIKHSKKHADTKNYDEQQVCDEKSQSLNQKYNFRLSDWKKIKSNLNADGMTKRHGIICHYCVSQDAPIGGVTFEDDAELLHVIS